MSIASIRIWIPRPLAIRVELIPKTELTGFLDVGIVFNTIPTSLLQTLEKPALTFGLDYR